MIYFPGVVIFLLSCRTHPSPLQPFQMMVYIIIMRAGVPVRLLVISNPQISPY
jgi:hypothetical protein